MQLQMKRSQREAGVLSKSVIFCLDARSSYTPQEAADINKYKLANEVVYSSENARRLAERAATHANAEGGSTLKALAAYAASRLSLNVTVGSLAQGHHIECKTMDELFAAEEALMEACRAIQGYLAATKTFDGRQLTYDFGTDEAAGAIIPAALEPPARAAAFPA